MMKALADDIAFDLANELRRRKAFFALPEAQDPPKLVDQMDIDGLVWVTKIQKLLS